MSPLSRISSRIMSYAPVAAKPAQTASVGAIAVAVSDPNVVYVGSGEGLHRPDLSVGDGIYKSTDAGKTWTHLGLRDGQQIAQLAVDPTNAERVFVAVGGHPYGPNEERGVYRSLDNGTTWSDFPTASLELDNSKFKMRTPPGLSVASERPVITQLPRCVKRIQSPWRQTPGNSSK